MKIIFVTESSRLCSLSIYNVKHVFHEQIKYSAFIWCVCLEINLNAMNSSNNFNFHIQTPLKLVPFSWIYYVILMWQGMPWNSIERELIFAEQKTKRDRYWQNGKSILMFHVQQLWLNDKTENVNMASKTKFETILFCPPFKWDFQCKRINVIRRISVFGWIGHNE